MVVVAGVMAAGVGNGSGAVGTKKRMVRGRRPDGSRTKLGPCKSCTIMVKDGGMLKPGSGCQGHKFVANLDLAHATGGAKFFTP